MFDKLRLLLLARRLKKCRVTTLSNGQLRAQKVFSDGVVMSPLDFIDKTAQKLPKIRVSGKDVDYEKRMKDLFYKHGLTAVNLYISYIKLRTKIEIKKKNLPLKK